MTISKRMVLRSAFGIMIGLLAVSTFMAYRVQQSFSERSAEIHRKFVAEQELLTNLRRALYVSGIALRDSFIDPTPDHPAVRAQLAEFESEANAQIVNLHKLSARQQSVSALREHFSHFWSAIRMAADADWTPMQKYQFVQQEIVPRRDAAGQILREIERANHTSLTSSEEEFNEMRTGATNRLMAALGACLFCGLVVAWFSTRHSENLECQSAQRFAEVSEAKQELERLSARLMEVQEEERMRLSRELHDEIVQNLAVLKMDIARAQTLAGSSDSSLAEGLARARRLAETTVQSVRNISLLLRPSLLDDLGLIPALQWQTEEFTRRTAIECEFVDQLADDHFSDSVKTCVYRVTQEALRNCEKHSRARRVQVKVATTISGNLLVQIEDDGIGLPAGTSRSPAQLGILGMRERAAAVGGSLTLSRGSKHGSLVSLTIPLTGIHRQAVSA